MEVKERIDQALAQLVEQRKQRKEESEIISRVAPKHKIRVMFNCPDPEDFDEKAFLAKVVGDKKLSEREKIKIGLMCTMAKRKGTEMRVTDPNLKFSPVQANCESYGCISQQYLDTQMALPADFHALKDSLTCNEWSGITDRNDSWNFYAVAYGNNSSMAKAARQELWDYIRNL